MAGFDFDLRFHPATYELTRSLLRFAQGEARDWGLDLTYRKDRSVSSYYVTVDGPLPAMQSLLPGLSVQLPAFASGQSEPKSRSARVAIARRLVGEYATGLEGIDNAIHDIATRFGAEPNSLTFRASRASHLADRLAAFSGMLLQYHSGFLHPDHIAEDAHTVLEQILRHAIGRPSEKMTFQRMVDTAKSRGWLSEEQWRSATRLKELRNKAKHRSQSVAESEIKSMLPSVLTAIHSLLRSIQD